MLACRERAGLGRRPALRVGHEITSRVGSLPQRRDPRALRSVPLRSLSHRQKPGWIQHHRRRKPNCHRSSCVDPERKRASRVMTRYGSEGAHSAVNSARRASSSPSTGSARSLSFWAVKRTGRRLLNSATPRLTLMCPLLPKSVELVPVRTVLIPEFSVLCSPPM